LTPLIENKPLLIADLGKEEIADFAFALGEIWDSFVKLLLDFYPQIIEHWLFQNFMVL